MAKTDFKSVDEYTASQPEAAQGVLKRAEHHPQGLAGAEEVISYHILAYKLHVRRVLFIAGWK